jgi:hypothetical protein
MTPETTAERQRSGVKITRNTKTIQAEVHCYNGDTDMAEAIAAAKAAFLDLDAFCQQVTEGELASKLQRSVETAMAGA